jgi:hypothetical protein
MLFNKARKILKTSKTLSQLLITFTLIFNMIQNLTKRLHGNKKYF